MPNDLYASGSSLSRRALLAGGMACLASCERVTGTYMYALTLLVEENGRARQATSVVRVTGTSLPAISLSQNLSRTYCRGEATAITFSDGSALVALMEGRPTELTRQLFKFPRWLGYGPGTVIVGREGVGRHGERRQNSASFRAGYILRPDELPTLIYYSDRLSRLSGIAISPDKFPFEIKSGLILRGVDLEIGPRKSSPRQIEGILPWLKSEKQTYLGNTDSCSDTCTGITVAGFKG